ncbi:MAG: RCC1 repeat-containing protein, partial [Actinomycetes bacterium]
MSRLIRGLFARIVAGLITASLIAATALVAIAAPASALPPSQTVLYVVPNNLAVAYGGAAPAAYPLTYYSDSAPTTEVVSPNITGTAPACTSTYVAMAQVASPVQITCSGGSDAAYLFDTTATAALTIGGARVAAGLYHSCAVLATGAAQCWGYNGSGQLGDGTTSNSNLPVTVSTITTAVSVTAGYQHSCAVLSSGKVWCWGWNGDGQGQLGNNSTANASAPVQVTGLPATDPALSVVAGYAHTCALLASGLVYCWGGNWLGQLGNGGWDQSTTAVQVSGITDAVSISAGDSHSCAVLASGQIKCWGYNGFGQLGDGTTGTSNVAVLVVGLSGAAVGVATGADFSCAALATGAVQCWGANSYGQLGDGTTSESHVPVTVLASAVVPLTGVASLSAGGRYACAVLSSGGVDCWGHNPNGELGDGTTTDSSSPATVSLPAGVTAASVSAGGYHACAALTSGAVLCWGDNAYGGLGDGTTTQSLSPVLVLPGVETLSATLYVVPDAQSVTYGDAA